MALDNTTFTALTSGTRNSKAEKGAQYFLNGNTTNGRLNIDSSAIWEVGDNTHIHVNGNPNHSYMEGIIKATGLTYIGNPTGGGRLDFSGSDGGLQTTDLTYVYLGNGRIFNHLENTRNIFNGFTRFIIDMTGGDAFIQFANREYKNILFNVKSSNLGRIAIYMARRHDQYTSLPNFGTRGLGDSDILELIEGDGTNSHGRIYDPVYEGVTDNLLKLKVSTTAGVANNDFEYFTIDVTAIRHDDARIRVVSGASIQRHNKNLTVANTTLDAYGGTPLDYYSGKNVVECLVRTITTTTSSTREVISYVIRRAGYQEIKVDNLAMNAPVIIEEMIMDTDYSSTGTITLFSNLDEVYDKLEDWLVDNLATNNFVSKDGVALDLAGYSLIVDKTAGTLLDVNTTTDTITIKADDLVVGEFKTIKTTGTISTANGGIISVPYEDTNGVIVKVSAPANFTIKGTGIAYTQNTNNITTQVASGTVVEYAIWSLGKKIVYVTQTINEPTTIDINYESEAFVDTGLDVSAQVSNIDASNVGGILTYKFGEMELTLEQAKAVSHRIFEDEIALDLVLTNNATGVVDLLQDSIRINAPVVHLERKDALTISQEVNLRSYIDITNAVAINPAYILTPADTDGLRVIYYKDPIAIDYDQIENKVWNGTDGTLIKAQQKNQLTEISKVSNP